MKMTLGTKNFPISSVNFWIGALVLWACCTSRTICAKVVFLPTRVASNWINPSLLIVGMLGLIMTGMGLIGNLAKIERRIGFLEIDAFALIVVYIAGLVLLYLKGVAV